MKTNSKSKKSVKIKKIIFAVALVLVVALVAILVVPKLLPKKVASTRITTYKVDEITYGNVSTTISGSGSLTPITKETLTAVELLDEDESEEESEDEVETAAETSGQTGTMPGMGTVQTPAVLVGAVVDTVNVKVGDTVSEGDVIATIRFEDEESDEETDEESEEETVTTRDIIAPYDAVILEFYLDEDTEIADSTNVAMFMGTEGYTMSISVDENNISTVELGQEVEVKIDAVSGTYTGAVTDISYDGSTSGSTTSYKIEATFDYVEKTYPGMSVSAEIVIEDSGEGLLVPVDAVYTSGDTKYVYLAPGSASLGDEYDEGDLDLSKLEKVTVTTGMSDGTYIMIESSSLSEDDLIIITSITSTMTGSEGSDRENGGMSGFPGGMGGGSFPGGSGGGFDFGDMPEGFNPGQFGGGSFPGFGG